MNKINVEEIFVDWDVEDVFWLLHERQAFDGCLQIAKQQLPHFNSFPNPANFRKRSVRRI
jgi:hypothetical protein